jgi:dipeptidyl aminopeptidase/acylaminoacyl peptidase
MSSRILKRRELDLSPEQIKMIKSGWSNDAVDKTTVEKIIYDSGGLKVSGYIAYPKDKTKKFPSIIWCRGGLGELGIIDEFNAQGILGTLASWGYVVFATQYRGNDGSEGHDEFGGSDIEDVLNLIPLAKEIPNADEHTWGIEGWSRGGMMTYLALMKTNIFKAAITIGGVADLRCDKKRSKFVTKLVERNYGKITDEAYRELCESRTIINQAEKINKETPILLIHGVSDDRVPVDDSIELTKRLIKFKSNIRLVLLEEGTHFLRNHKNELNWLRKNWFDKYLKGENHGA